MTSKSITFRCPDALLDYIERQVEKTKTDRTTVMVRMLQVGMNMLGEDGSIDVSQTPKEVRQIVSEMLEPLQKQLNDQQEEYEYISKVITPLQVQVEELRGKLTKVA